MVALSVSISTSSSPRATSSPSALSQRMIVPSSIESDRRGMTISYTVSLLLVGERAAHAVGDPLDARDPELLQRSGVRDRGLVATDQQRRRIEGVEAVGHQAGDDRRAPAAVVRALLRD